MLAFTKPTFTEEQRKGLKGPSVSFAVSGASDLHYNEPAATLIDALIGGEWEEPELEGGPIPPTSEPARRQHRGRGVDGGARRRRAPPVAAGW